MQYYLNNFEKELPLYRNNKEMDQEISFDSIQLSIEKLEKIVQKKDDLVKKLIRNESELKKYDNICDCKYSSELKVKLEKQCKESEQLKRQIEEIRSENSKLSKVSKVQKCNDNDIELKEKNNNKNPPIVVDQPTNITSLDPSNPETK